MRTYLTTAPTSSPDYKELVMTCNCGATKRLAEFVDAQVRPSVIGSINLLRLMEWAGQFANEHSACPSEPKP